MCNKVHFISQYTFCLLLLDNYIPKSGTQQDVTNPRKYFNSA